MQIQRLVQVPVEPAEAIFVIAVHEHAHHIAIVVQSLVQLVQQIKLHVATLSLWRAISVVQVHNKHRIVARC